MIARPALACALAALLGIAALPAQAGPTVIHGKGTATYDNYAQGLHCPGFALDVELAGTPDFTLAQIQAINTDAPFCFTNGYLYSANPYVLTGDAEHGWVGEAVGVQCVPACLPEVPLVWPVWPTWPVTILPTGAPGEYHLWSYYVDVNDREYLMEGDFTVDVTV